MTCLVVDQFPCLADNYGFLVHEPSTGSTAAIDTPDVTSIQAALRRRGWNLTHILNTHWHDDHAGGNLALKETFGATVVGPRAEADRIPGIDKTVGEGDEIQLGAAKATVLATPGHTAGHIVYWFADDDVLFVGDTLFSLGCGRLFEGTAAQMWHSLSKLKALPHETRVYCAHEYTQNNAAFAITVEPHNARLRERVAEIERLRSAGLPTVPSNIGLEVETNPFLRADSTEIREQLAMAGRDDVDVFIEIRARKDRFRG